MNTRSPMQALERLAERPEIAEDVAIIKRELEKARSIINTLAQRDAASPNRVERLEAALGEPMPDIFDATYESDDAASLAGEGE